MSQLNESKAKGIGYLAIIAVVVVLAVILFSKFIKIGHGLFQGLGLEATPEEKENKGIIDNATRGVVADGTNNAWSPNFYKTGNGKIFTQAQTNKMVSDLWDSVGYFYDTPQLLTGVIKQCVTKSQVSWLCYNFQQKYSLDLFTWLSEHYDTSTQQFILASAIKYVDALPKFN